jgi:hypothetical protein
VRLLRARLAGLPPQEVRKTVTIVFSDLKGSTNLGEALDPESLREVMTRYFEMRRARSPTVDDREVHRRRVMAGVRLPKLQETTRPLVRAGTQAAPAT